MMTATLAAMRAEYTKLLITRGALIALLLFALVAVAVGALDGWSAKQAIRTHSPLLARGFTPEQAGTVGVLYGQVALIAFGVLVVTNEYRTGMIRLSLLAMPRRGQFYAAKMIVAALASAVIAIPGAIVAYAATQVALGPYGASIDAAGVPRSLAGASAYLVLMCLFAAGIAVITRSTVAPLAILIPVVLVGSHLLTLIGPTKVIAKYLPDQAGMQMLAIHTGHGALTPAAGAAVLLAWVVAAQAGGYLLHQFRDA
jgi:ABC-type transport system involved in multi-copper enzyme maturation permease subunit